MYDFANIMEMDSLKIEKLQNVSQWNLWKFQVKIILSSSDVFCVVSGDSPAPPAADEKYAAWLKLDMKAQRVIATTVGQQPLLHILNCKTAKDMWDKLFTVYEQKSNASIHLLQQRFYSYTKDPADGIANHIAKLEEIVQQLKDLKEEISDTMVITKILMTLPANYNHFHSAWESTPDDKKTLDHLRSRLMIEESRIETQSSTDSGEAFMARQGKAKSNGRRANTKKIGKCFKCGISGHWKTNCPKLQSSGSKRGEDGDALMCETQGSDDQANQWYLDSGASDHMCNRSEWFKSYTSFSTPTAVRVGNGDRIMAYGRGNIDVMVFDGKKWTLRYLAEVLYVPDIKLNLFSTGQVLDRGFSLSSDSENCKLSRGGVIFAVGVRQAKLFRMLFKVVVPEKSCVMIANLAVKNSDSLKVWHERLGHQNIQHVKGILKSLCVKYTDESDFLCEACVVGKHHRTGFRVSSYKASARGDMVHTDVCGKMEVQSVGGAKYFLLFKDDYSGYRTVFFMKEKSEVADHLKFFVKNIKKENGVEIKVLRSDNGTEYINKEVESFLRDEGIRHQRSVPYTPEQNGRAEREMRTIVEAARTMLHARQLERKFWAEAVNTAVYVLNRTAPTRIADKTPFELWHGKKPNIDNFKVFGSEVYVHIPKQKRQKWDPKAVKGMFLGYAENSKGYRIWNPTARKVEIVRDIVFNEIVNNDCTYNDVFVLSQSSGESNESVSDISKAESTKEYHSDLEEESEESSSFSTPEKVDTPIRDSTPYQYYMRPRTNASSTSLAFADQCAFLAEHCHEPTTYNEAVNCEQNSEWITAMDDEMQSLKKNNTWRLANLPENQSVIDNRWIYKIKCKPNGDIERFKARLVVRGFTQEYGINYFETFSPVVKFTSIRTILAIAASDNLVMCSFDVKTAFLYGELQEEIYMVQPKGYEDGTGRVCRLQKSLYGLKQSSRCWNLKFTSFLQEFNFTSCKADPCVFISQTNAGRIFLAIYIDDGLVVATDEKLIGPLLAHLRQEFEVKVFDTKQFLGLEINRNKDGAIFLHQSGYVRRVLEKFGMKECNPVSTPSDLHQKLEAVKVAREVKFPYREVIGSLMYMSVATRPDISFSVNYASRYFDNPTAAHVQAVKRILKYLKRTADYGILFQPKYKLTLCGYSDADFAGDIDTRRSTSGYVFMLGESVISWCSERQKTVALSTTESEYVAAANAAKELVWLRQLLSELLPNMLEAPKFYLDNQSAIQLIKNPEYHKRTKHIDIKYHFIRELFVKNFFDLEFVSTKNQIADILTKSLPKPSFENFRELMNVVCLE